MGERRTNLRLRAGDPWWAPDIMQCHRGGRTPGFGDYRNVCKCRGSAGQLRAGCHFRTCRGRRTNCDIPVWSCRAHPRNVTGNAICVILPEASASITPKIPVARPLAFDTKKPRYTSPPLFLFYQVRFCPSHMCTPQPSARHLMQAVEFISHRDI